MIQDESDLEIARCLDLCFHVYLSYNILYIRIRADLSDPISYSVVFLISVYHAGR